MSSSELMHRRDRMAAIWIGVLFIIGTVTLVLSLIVTAGILAGPDVLAGAAAAPTEVAIGALLVVIAAIALGMVPVVFWPIGRRHSATLTMGYVIFRGAIETVLYLAIALGWLVIAALATEPDAAPLARLVTTAEGVLSTQVLSIPFAVGALLFNAVLFRSRLVPRWLSAWGLVGATLYLMAPLTSMFGVSIGALMGPLAVQEMALATWLIAKGFSPAVVDAGTADVAARWTTSTATTAPTPRTASAS
jgi:hypothetical protein